MPLNVEGETETFKLAFVELVATVDSYAEIQSLLVPLLLIPLLSEASYLLMIIKLMDARHRLICMQRELYEILYTNSQCEENASVIISGLAVLDDVIDKYLEGARQCPEFLN